MFDEAFEPKSTQSEATLRAEIEAIERERVDMAEARLDFWRWDGLLFIPLLFRIGKSWVVWLTVLIVVVELALVGTLRSLPAALLALVLLVVVEVYEYQRLEAWVAAHNARLDARIRALLGAGADETP